MRPVNVFDSDKLKDSKKEENIEANEQKTIREERTRTRTRTANDNKQKQSDANSQKPDAEDADFEEVK